MKVHLFTDIDSLLQQSSNKEFGTVTQPTSGSQKFQVTSIHNCISNSKTYAITDGLIMIQPNLSDSSLVNILLKPTTQTIDNVTVEYFIYRGVKKDSIFGNSKINLSGNDLCNEINKTIIKLNLKYPTIMHAPEEYILAYGAEADNDFTTKVYPFGLFPEDILVDSMMNTKNMKYKPFPIKAGMHIGNFHTEFGIDVILTKARIKLSEVRMSDNFIVSNNLDGLTGEDFINNKTEKEKILNYFDICQFYSLVYQKTGIWVKNSSDPAFSKMKQNNQIVNILNKFKNSNVLFLDIRNEYNNSLNYQNNIAGTIAIKKDNNSYDYVIYPEWPLLKISIQSVTNLYIKIPKSDFVNVRAYFRESNDNSFSFKAINFDSSNYSTELKIRMNKTNSSTTLPSYFNFMFLREVDNDTLPTEWVIKSRYFIDTIFDVEDLMYTDANANLHLKGLTYYNKSTKWKIHEDNKYAGADIPYIAKVGTAEDQHNYYFFAFSNGDALKLNPVDIPITTGESVKENFLEDILFPRFNNTISIYSYKITQGSQNFYILKDSINSNAAANSQKLVQSNKNFVLIAIDKEENLSKLRDAYLAFANNLPKRLVIRERHEVSEPSTKSHWEAEIFLIGYGNDSITNSFKIKEINTGIKILYSTNTQRILGTNQFNERYFKTTLQINSENFYGKVPKNIRFQFRNLPKFKNGSAGKFESGRRDIYVKVLGKCKNPNNDETWYYVELINDESDFSKPNEKKGIKGSRYFIHKDSGITITAKFDSFLDELISVNNDFDNATTGSQNDTLEERITRFRQRGHDSDVDLFNKVITTGDALPGKIYKDQIPYKTDELIPIAVQVNTQTVEIIITNKLQLYRDIEVVEFSNGRMAEVQHMFVGLDVIGRLKEDFTIWYRIIVPINVPNNIHYSLHSGDAGSVPNQVYNYSIIPSKQKGNIWDAIKFLYDEDIQKGNNLSSLESRFYEHFLNTRFALHDRYGNLYSFGLYYQMFETTWIYEPPNPTVSQKINSLFSSFNNDIETSESDSLRYFYNLFKGNLSKPINSYASPANGLLYNKLRENTFSFSKLWRIKEEKTEIIGSQDSAYLEKYSNWAIQEYIDLINLLRNTYL
ncbi:MAG: hypothetical protein M9916_06240 [Crocinitomicaceae bacterium]|nr:hypothetical protein [Crocinitomicaceae bacterium]